MYKAISFIAPIVCLLISLITSTLAFSQNFINKDYQKVKKSIAKYKPINDSTTISLQETDSSILMSIRGTGSQPADFLYRFNKERKCISEKITAYCDSCYKKFLGDLLAKKMYKWKKINENQYISGYNWKMMIELPVKEETSFFYIILRTNWNKKLYQLIEETKSL
jgi:hypothetical protein